MACSGSGVPSFQFLGKIRPMVTSNHSAALAFLQSSSLPMLMQEEIERLIMTGELPVGSRINESELSQRFNTSRGPIREALRALEEAGLVRNEKNRGVFVREIAFEEADEIYELREAVEEIIGRRVALAIKLLADPTNPIRVWIGF
eukprot:gene581-750_t